MGRNLFSRIETCFPIEDKKLRKQILEEGLMNYLQDNRRAWELQADGTWIHKSGWQWTGSPYCPATINESNYLTKNFKSLYK
jgi:polyphosphate kinase